MNEHFHFGVNYPFRINGYTMLKCSILFRYYLKLLRFCSAEERKSCTPRMP